MGREGWGGRSGEGGVREREGQIGIGVRPAAHGLPPGGLVVRGPRQGRWVRPVGPKSLNTHARDGRTCGRLVVNDSLINTLFSVFQPNL